MRVKCCYCGNIFDNQKNIDDGKGFCNRECESAKANLDKWATQKPRTNMSYRKRNEFLNTQACSRFPRSSRRDGVLRG